jgi:prevent-host-death family protein
MKISVTEAKAQLTELVRRAEAGEEILLTRHGQIAARLTQANAPIGRAARRKLLESVRAAGARKAGEGERAARSQDFLYGEDGLPK